MSGFAGSSPAKKQRREAFVSKKRSQNLRAECAGLVAGPVAPIAKKVAQAIEHSDKPKQKRTEAYDKESSDGFEIRFRRFLTCPYGEKNQARASYEAEKKYA